MALFQSPPFDFAQGSRYGLLPEGHFHAHSGVTSYEATYRSFFLSPVSF